MNRVPFPAAIRIRTHIQLHIRLCQLLILYYLVVLDEIIGDSSDSDMDMGAVDRAGSPDVLHEGMEVLAKIWKHQQ